MLYAYVAPPPPFLQSELYWNLESLRIRSEMPCKFDLFTWLVKPMTWTLNYQVHTVNYSQSWPLHLRLDIFCALSNFRAIKMIICVLNYLMMSTMDTEHQVGCRIWLISLTSVHDIGTFLVHPKESNAHFPLYIIGFFRCSYGVFWCLAYRLV